MVETTVGPFEEILKGQFLGLSSVSEDFDGNLSAITSEGFLYSMTPQGYEKKIETGGQPYTLIHESSNTIFITDLAQQAIYSYTDEESLQEVIRGYEGKPFLGPNSLAFHENSNSLYFTDSGPMGETSLLNPRGSVFVADIEQGTIKPIILNALAHPAGIAITQDGKHAYVAETFRNRILKISFASNGNCFTTVFYQFSGRLGPTALCISESNLIYVANYEFQSLNNKGKISVLTNTGALKKYFHVPISEITSMSFSRVKNNILYITGSGRSFKVTIPGEIA